MTELLRFVLDPDGRVTPDLRNRLPGRGVWVSANAATVAPSPDTADGRVHLTVANLQTMVGLAQPGPAGRI